MKKLSTWVILIVIIVGGIWWSRSFQESDSSVISSRGIHWHPTLAIYIDDERIEIPSGIGLVGGHAPIHTHDTTTDTRETGVAQEIQKPLHLEFGSAVRENDVVLKNFFAIWGQKFSSECILDKCISDGGSIIMTVNGEVNSDYENYVMQDNDKIEIFYKSESSETSEEINE